MTKEYLIKILQNSTSESFNVNNCFTNGFFERLYEPEYLDQPIDERRMNECFTKALCFDYKQNNMSFNSASLSCAGLTFVFKNDRFEKIYVTALYDYKTNKIYNSVLAVPSYTPLDYNGKKTISQSANTVRSNSDLKRYFKRLYKRFICPLQISNFKNN